MLFIVFLYFLSPSSCYWKDRDGFDDGSVESDSDSDVPEELKQEYIDEHTGETQPNQ